MLRKFFFIFAILMIVLAVPSFAAEEAEEAAMPAQYRIYGMAAAALTISLSAGLGALAQGRACSSACSAIARNPGAEGGIRFIALVSLVLIESLVLYALLVALVQVGII